MADFKDLKIIPISRRQAVALCEKKHYMRTYPQGAALNFGFVNPENRIHGVCVFGYSSATPQKIAALGIYGLKRSQYLEMQRLWISDDYHHNTESFILARTVDILRGLGVQLIITHAGGCKNDCGIVYQASGWLYFGSTPCNDFFLTADGEYKNLAAAKRFGRASGKLSFQEAGEALFGPGTAIQSRRYTYVYPINKAIRRRLSKLQLPFPKDSAVFRKDQQWVTNGEGTGVQPS